MAAAQSTIPRGRRRERSPHIRSGLKPRTIYFPERFLDRIETRPGALVELLTVALSAHLQTEGGAK